MMLGIRRCSRDLIKPEVRSPKDCFEGVQLNLLEGHQLGGQERAYYQYAQS